MLCRIPQTEKREGKEHCGHPVQFAATGSLFVWRQENDPIDSQTVKFKKRKKNTIVATRMEKRLFVIKSIKQNKRV